MYIFDMCSENFRLTWLQNVALEVMIGSVTVTKKMEALTTKIYGCRVARYMLYDSWLVISGTFTSGSSDGVFEVIVHHTITLGVCVSQQFFCRRLSIWICWTGCYILFWSWRILYDVADTSRNQHTIFENILDIAQAEAHKGELG